MFSPTLSTAVKRLLAVLMLLILALGMQLIPTSPFSAPLATAQTAEGCHYRNGGPLADQLCWIELDDFNLTQARTVAGQPMEIIIAGEYRLTFNLHMGVPAGRVFPTVTTPNRATWSDTTFGNNVGGQDFYVSSPQDALKPVTFYNTGNTLSTQWTTELRNISMTRISTGARSNYGLVVADAESTNLNESFGVYSNVATQLLQLVNPPGRQTCANGAPTTGASNTYAGLTLTGGVVCQGRSGDVGMMLTQATNPTTVRAVLSSTSSSNQGVAFAVRVSQATGSVVSEVETSTEDSDLNTDPAFSLSVAHNGITLTERVARGPVPARVNARFPLSLSQEIVTYRSDLAAGSGYTPNLFQAYTSQWTCTVRTTAGTLIRTERFTDVTSVNMTVEGGRVVNCDVVWRSRINFTGELELAKFVTGTEGGFDLPTGEIFTLNYECTQEEFEQAYAGTDYLDRLQGAVEVIDGAAPDLIQNMPLGAQCEITEEEPEVNPLVDWVLRWRDSEPAGDPVDGATEAESFTVTLATGGNYVAAVNDYVTELVALDLAVARVGNGRDLYTGGYTYEVVCEADQWPGIEESINYPGAAVGDGVLARNGELALAGTSAPRPEPIDVVPGASCEVTTEGPGLEARAELEPTGDSPTRTPYTYFLATEGTDVVVSGENGTGDTPFTDDGVRVDADDRVQIERETVGDEWKDYTFRFTIPDDLEPDDSYTVNIVHAYDLDTREIVVNKEVLGIDPVGESFDFEYSTNGGDTFTEVTGINNGDSFTFDADINTDVIIRERLGDNPQGPVADFQLRENDTELAGLSASYQPGLAVAEFEVVPVTDPGQVDTAPWAVDVTNAYTQLELSKFIDGPQVNDEEQTTIIPDGATEMTITYTVRNTGAVALNTVTLRDPSLAGFTLGNGVTVDDNGILGNLDCNLVDIAPGAEVICTVTVVLDDPTSPFDYGDEAEADGLAGPEDRQVRSTAVDYHGAIRLAAGTVELPNTGATTLVWVLGLGVMVSVGALIIHLRNRRQ